MIVCTMACIYQKDGLCGLDHAASSGNESSGDACRYCISQRPPAKAPPGSRP